MNNTLSVGTQVKVLNNGDIAGRIHWVREGPQSGRFRYCVLFEKPYCGKQMDWFEASWLTPFSSVEKN